MEKNLEEKVVLEDKVNYPIPFNYNLSQNYPNPFKYSMAGQKVRT